VVLIEVRRRRFAEVITDSHKHYRSLLYPDVSHRILSNTPFNSPCSSVNSNGILWKKEEKVNKANNDLVGILRDGLRLLHA
jgi:hypothetical protein